MPIPTEGRLSLTLNLGHETKSAVDARARAEGRTTTELVKAAVLLYLQRPASTHPDVASLLDAAATEPQRAPDVPAPSPADLVAQDLRPLLQIAATRQEALEATVQANHQELLDAIDDLAAAVGRRIGADLAIEQPAADPAARPRG